VAADFSRPLEASRSLEMSNIETTAVGFNANAAYPFDPRS